MTRINPNIGTPYEPLLPTAGLQKKIGVRRHTHNTGFNEGFRVNPLGVIRESVYRAQTTLTRPISRGEYEYAQRYPYYAKRGWNNLTFGATYLARRVRRNMRAKPMLAALQGLGALALGAFTVVQGGVLTLVPVMLRGEATPAFRSRSATLEDRVLNDLTWVGWSLGLAHEHLRFSQLSGEELKECTEAALVALATVESGLKLPSLDSRVRGCRDVRKKLRVAQAWGLKLSAAVQKDIDDPTTRRPLNTENSASRSPDMYRNADELAS